MLKAVLVDDEPLSLDALELVLDRNEDVEVIGKYSDPVEALKNIEKLRPELVFLDIQMPEIDGLSAAREIINMGLDTHIIFATVFEQYALKAFDMDAADYVMKPFSESRIRLTVNRVIKRMQSRRIIECPMHTLVKENSTRNIMNKIPAWKENSIVLIDPEAIAYFSMNEKKVIVHTRENAYESKYSLAELEDRLESKGFLRCHKSFLVNTDYIDKIVPWFNSTYMIKLKHVTEQIPVSRHYTKQLKEILHI